MTELVDKEVLVIKPESILSPRKGIVVAENTTILRIKLSDTGEICSSNKNDIIFLPVTENAFYNACKIHDFSYMYSDSPRHYAYGVASFRKITLMANQIGFQKASEIWNKVVDEKFVEPYRKDFYCKWVEVKGENHAI